jgi:hypothetical protein
MGQILYKACIWTLEKRSKGKLRKLHNVQIQNLYCSPDTKTFTTSRRVSQKGCVIKNEETRKAHKNYLKLLQIENT